MNELSAANLRRIAAPRRRPTPIEDSDVQELKMLLHSLMKPANTLNRRTQERDYAISYEHAYYKSLGDDAAVLRTAELWGLSRRTVSNAVKTYPIQMAPDSTRSPELSATFAAVRKEWLRGHKRKRTR